MSGSSSTVAVLTSGGLESGILVAELAERHDRVQPIYIRAGLYWESVELDHLRKYLQAIQQPSLQPLVILEQPVAELYESHWSLTGVGVPDAGSADEAVDLPGRNMLLLCKALIWCHLQRVPRLAIGVLASNPFPDATDGFFEKLERAANQAMGRSVIVDRPFGRYHKVDVLQRGKNLPLQWTFSCIRPVAGRHCGHCNKCAERQKAFTDTRISDPTEYSVE